MYGMWMKSNMSMIMLALEAQAVIAQRMMMFAFGGPKAAAEMERMISEKLFAAGDAAMQLASGASQTAIVNGYRRKVRANSRRLAR